ncbi:uncharacterized protein EI90DRAFT_2910408 [Cantharellus anzutake]|uniref:uncharacterized protein n=1 Tax=Cantharellus anzutake TaxID=1750568 RepID=UPI0019089613|nr:uncharacterized protein EI90DRAFT_2910408 [Cantharellus anzutake]KAF8337468.1 hypothetical protein EI90DRAFT_2910408 [Cantharellus anzutake]
MELQSSQGEDADVADDDFDPWGDGKIDVSDTTPFIPPPLSLPDFLLHGALWGALQLARDCHFEVLQLLVDKHSNDLFPYRFAILDAIPLHAHPMRYLSLFPSVNVVNGEEQRQSRRSPREQDWVESEDGKSLYFLALPQDLSDYIHLPTFGLHSQPSSLTHNQLQNWYKARIAQIEAEAGLTDIALELAQVAASLGVSGLEHLGEELSLLSRLIYDAPRAQEQNLVDAAQWSLSRWQSSDTQTIIQGYLKSSTTETISDDIRRLVIPYLYVLESRLERAGRPDANLHTHLLYDYILSAPLEFCLSIFDASKPVNPSSTRIIRNDEDLARLALARLYSSDELDQWSIMSNIFECLPEWPTAAEHQHDGDAEAETTLASLTEFVQPSTTRSNVAPPQDLFAFFKPLLSTALSHALDILDVHLECGEILARWGVAAPLFWFLQSARDERQQRAWATRMARRPSFGTYGDGNGKGLEDEKGYARLLHDMVKLVGSTTSLARGAFRLLGRLEVTKIFFAGVLGTGRFDIAKKLLSNSQVKKLGPQTIEELCLAASREFYDNAESGNLHSGDMKLAYDCLSVPPLTDAIQAERSFIEATSKIYSFRVTSRPGILITPIEIRLIKDRLTLVARVLSENEGAYKYPDVILDLVYKLGYPKNDAVSEVKVYAMLSDSALQAEDFENAAATTERMVALLNQRQRLSPSSFANSSSTNESPVDEAREVCWHSCYQLGRQSEYKDAQRKMRLLGHALQLCPSENTLDILTVWRRLEDDTMGKFQEDREKDGRGSRGVNGLDRGSRSGALATGSLRAQLSEYAASAARPRLLDQGADAAAIAAKTFNRVAANFPLSLRGMRNRNSEDDGTPRSGSPDVGSQARQAISRGWVG